MSTKDTNYKKKILAGCLTVAIALVGIPFYSASAISTPVLSIRNVTIQEEDVAENRNVGIDLVISNNQNGFRANSFGIHYNENLNYTNAEMLTSTGEAFDIVCNPDEHLLWFVGGGSSREATASTLLNESIITLYFDIAENIDTGDFGLNFVWSGLDGSDAYWYTDTEINIVDELSANSSNGMISFYNPNSEVINYTTLQLNPNAHEQLEILNADDSVFWFSSNPEIAAVDENGIVNAIAPGECQIQGYINNHIFSCDVTVLDAFYYSVADSTELTLTDANATVILKYPEAEGTVTWISANPAVITVDSDGKLHALKNGTANILATCNSKTYMKVITVDFNTTDIPPITDEPNTTVAPMEIQIGDIDNNDSIDILDVIMLNKAVLGKEILTETQLKAADLNENGTIDAEDSLRLMKIIVGLE